jgi:sugar (pentulose or hexulose) kinase/threonine dehydrogenase-like Zn-dependent dehydrogenase
MRALVIGSDLPRLAATRLLSLVSPRAYVGPLAPIQLREIPAPAIPAPDWAVVRTRLCGLCGSDYKQVFMNGSFDNPMTAMISWPQVLGHEVVGVIDEVGPGVTQRQIGERVVLNPWLSCATRGLPPCDWCEEGDLAQCLNTALGSAAPGIHTGNSATATGGFAPRVPAHESQWIPIPDAISDDAAVLADPFSVSLHAILRTPPPPGATVLVYGVGTLGLLAIAILRALRPDVRVLAVARFDHQARLAEKFGAERVLRHEPPLAVIEGVASACGAEIARAVARPADAARWRRRNLRHRVGARDLRGRSADRKHPRQHRGARRRAAAPLRVDAALLQGDLDRRLERLRDRGVRRPPPARDRMVLRVPAHEADRRHRDHHPPLRARGLPRRIHDLLCARREQRREGAVRPLRRGDFAMSRRLLMGIDLGGGSVRCALLDAETGACSASALAFHSDAAEGTSGLGYEIDTDELWKTVGQASRGALARANASPTEVAGVAVTAMRFASVLLDAAGEVLFAVPNRDARSIGESHRIATEHGEAVLTATGMWPLPIQAAPRLAWLRSARPELFERATTLLSLSDWLNFRLCGRRITDYSQAGCTGVFDLRRREWNQDLIDAFELPRALFPEARPSGERIGALSAHAARELGLAPGTPVALGGGDTRCGLFGAGAIADGDVGLVAGTTAPLERVLAEPVIDAEGRLRSGHHAVLGRYVLEANAGPIGEGLAWLARLLYPEEERAEERSPPRRRPRRSARPRCSRTSARWSPTTAHPRSPSPRSRSRT